MTKLSKGQIMTQARREASRVIKDAIHAMGYKVSDYAAASITTAASEYLKAHPEIIERIANAKPSKD